jgi:hypothetical protein
MPLRHPVRIRLTVSEGDPMSKPSGSDSGFAPDVGASMSSLDRAGEDAVSDQGGSLEMNRETRIPRRRPRDRSRLLHRRHRDSSAPRGPAKATCKRSGRRPGGRPGTSCRGSDGRIRRRRRRPGAASRCPTGAPRGRPGAVLGGDPKTRPCQDVSLTLVDPVDDAATATAMGATIVPVATSG